MDWMLMPFRRYADFKGRSRRKEFWMFMLFGLIVYVVVAAFMLAGGLGAVMTGAENMTTASFGVLFWVGVVILAVFMIGCIVPSIAVTIRRLHDRDMSGWWYLGLVIAGQIPYIGPLFSIAFLVLMALPGTAGPNRFGEDPLDPTQAEVFA